MLLAGETTLRGRATCCRSGIVRPITVLALAGWAPPERCGPGVAGRLAMAWSLGTGIPLLGILVHRHGRPRRSQRGPGACWPRRSPSSRASGSWSARSRSRSRRARSPSRSRPCAGRWRASRRATYDARVPVDDGSEVGLLEAGFNSMAAGLRGARAAARPVRPPRRPRGRGSRARARRRGRAGRRAARGGGRVRRRDRLDRPGHAPPAARGGRPAEHVLLDRRRGRSRSTAGGSTSSRATPPCACSARPARAPTPPATRCGRPARSTSAWRGRSTAWRPASASRPARRWPATSAPRSASSTRSSATRSTRRPGCASSPSSVPSACSPPTRCCGAPTVDEAANWEVRDSIVLRGRDEPTQVAVPRPRLTAVS